MELEEQYLPQSEENRGGVQFQYPSTANISQMIKIVQDHMDECYEHRNYVEAEQAKIRIQELKEQEVIQKSQQMSLDQEAEKSQQEQRNINEYQNFHEKWD